MGAAESSERGHEARARLWWLAPRVTHGARVAATVDELWPYALGVVEPDLRPELARRGGLSDDSSLTVFGRGEQTPELGALGWT